MRTARAFGTVAMVAAAVLLAACGGGTDDGGAALGARDGGASPGAGDKAADLRVEAHDIGFDRDAYRVAGGSVDVEYVQRGALPHSLVVETADGRPVDGFGLEVGGDDTDRGTVDLPAGDYTLVCDVPGHREAGMEAELRVG